MAKLYEVDVDLYPLELCPICFRLIHPLIGGPRSHLTEREAMACAKLLERKRKWLLDF